MHATTILDQMVEEQNGYIRLIDAQDKGLSKYAVLEYVRQNEMERIAPGVYITEDAWEDRLYLLQIRNRNIIFHMRPPCTFITCQIGNLLHR